MARRSGVLLGALLGVLGLSVSVASAEHHWIGAGTGGNTASDPSDATTLFMNPANWQEGTAPGPYNLVSVLLTGPGCVNAQTGSFLRVTLDGVGAGCTLCIGEGVTFAAWMYEEVGISGMAGVVQTGGTHVPDRLHLGSTLSGSGQYALRDGEVNVSTTTIGSAGQGLFIQTGGRHAISGALTLAAGAEGKGDYILSNGDLSVGKGETIGYGGIGSFTQTGGTHAVGADLAVGRLPDSTGSYTLSGGVLTASSATLGLEGVGTFIQMGGSNTLSGLSLGEKAKSVGTYYLRNGDLTVAGSEYMGRFGSGTFTQTGGTHTVTSLLSLGYASDSLGTYTLRGGLLDAYRVVIGSLGTGTFVQTGGTHRAGDLLLAGSGATYVLAGGDLVVSGTETVGAPAGTLMQTGGTHTVQRLTVTGWSSVGTFSLSGGSLTVNSDELIGSSSGTGIFTQSGGTHTVLGALRIGDASPPCQGAFTLAGGNLIVGTLVVGPSGGGLLNLTSGKADLVVRDVFTLGPKASLRAVDGATVRITAMYGAAFENYSCDEIALAGLEYLTVAFDGTDHMWSTFEVAGRDLGAVPAGFQDNFSLGALVVGGAKPARLKLLDAYDNGNRSSAEALYLHDITVGQGSTLDLRNLHLYYDGRFVNEGTIVGGWPILVPEPATLALLALGGAAILSRPRRRPRMTGSALPKKS